MITTEEIAQYMQSKGLGKYDSTGATGNIFIGVLPQNIDECIAIYKNAGIADDPKFSYRNSNIQILVRSKPRDPRNAMQLADKIYDTLQGFNGQFVDNGLHVVDCVGIQGGPSPIGQDLNLRYEYSINFRIEIINYGE